MKKKTTAIVLLLIASFIASAQTRQLTNSLQLGYGRNKVNNQIIHGQIYSGEAFDEAKPKLGDHLALIWKKELKTDLFFITGIEADFSQYSYSTNVTPDSSFLTTEFFFRHKYTTLDIPLGLGKTTSLLKRSLSLSGGVGLGVYFNRMQESTVDLYIYNFNNESLAVDNDINLDHFFKFNASIWLRTQYKVLNYNCNPNKGGVWLEIMAKQNLMYNSNVNSYAGFIFEDRPAPNKYYLVNNFKNRPFFFSFSVLFDLK